MHSQVTAHALWMESLLSKAARSGVHLMLVKQAVSVARQSQAPALRRLRAARGFGHPPVPRPWGCCQRSAEVSWKRLVGNVFELSCVLMVTQPRFLPLIRKSCLALEVYEHREKVEVTINFSRLTFLEQMLSLFLGSFQCAFIKV